MKKCSGCGKSIVAKDGESFGGTTTLVDGKVTSSEMYCPKCYKLIPKPDDVNAPPHYIFGPYETIDIIEAWLRANVVSPSAGFLWASMVQYVFRYQKKKGAQDLKKAKWYLERLIKLTDEERDGD